MKKIKVKTNEYKKLSKKEAKEYYESDADMLELLLGGKRDAYIFIDEKNRDCVQSQSIAKDENPANIDVWIEDDFENVKDLVEIE